MPPGSTPASRMTTTRTGLLALVTIAGALACGHDETNPFVKLLKALAAKK